MSAKRTPGIRMATRLARRARPIHVTPLARLRHDVDHAHVGDSPYGGKHSVMRRDHEMSGFWGILRRLTTIRS